MVDIAACSSSQSAQGGKPTEWGHWARGVDAGDAGDASRPNATGTDDTASRDGGSDVRSSDIDNMGKQYIVPRPPSVIAEEDWGLKLTPEEKERVNTCSRRPWSKNVPDRDCTKDTQCGDGLCDRGHCAPIITCLFYPGAPCKLDKHCNGLCMEGRCRSCVSHWECQEKLGEDYGWCDPPGSHPPGRSCSAWHSPPPPDAVKAMCDAAPANKKPPYCPQP